MLPVKVAGLVMDNDFGLAYEMGFEAARWRRSVLQPITKCLNVFISTAGNPCLLAIQEVEASVWIAVHAFRPAGMA